MGNIKTYYLLFVALFAFSYSNAQSIGVESYTEIDTSMLYVPIIGYKPFDNALESALKKYWKVTSFKTISLKEYQKMSKENDALKAKPKAIESDKAAKERRIKSETNMKSLFSFGYQSFNFGKTHASADYQDKNELLPPVDYLENDNTFTEDISPKNRYKMGNIIPKMEYMVKSANDIVIYTLEKKLTAEWNVMYGVAGAVFNDKAPLIKDKTLLINSDAKSMNGATIFKEDVFAKTYPYPYKFVSSEEFYKVLASDSKEEVCLIPITGGWSYIMVYEPVTKSTIYREYAPRKGGFERFKEENVDDLVKKIKKISVPVKRLLPMDK